MHIQLQNGPCAAEIDTLGGELTSFRDGAGTEYIWGGDPAYWSGRNPVLFPIVGSLKDGRVRIQGREYEMGRHGFARRSQFTLAQQGPSHAVLELRENPDTLARYPFPFLLRVRHELLEDGFSTTFEMENPGDAPLPCCIGAHTAFRCPLYEGQRFEEYALVFDQVEDALSLPLTPQGLISTGAGIPILRGTDTIPLTHQPFDELDTLIFEGLRSTGVRLVHRDTGRGVRMDFQGFPMIAFWTPAHANAPFICLEPWHGCAALEGESGKLEDKPHCVTLEPGESAGFRYAVMVV